MAVKLKPLNQQVIVITGASSGIGLATAREAARRGARVLLAARNAAALAEIVREIAMDGGTAAYVEADVSRKEDIEKIAQSAVDHFGGFDTWINNAGVAIYGKVEEVNEGDSRQLFEVNFWGLVNGSLQAAKHLRKEGGAIINLGSAASDVTLPNLTMYSASKHAVKGFTDGLRAELEAEGAPISVTLIKPASIDTPFSQNARNYMNVEPKLPPPIYPVEEVARSVCFAAEHPRRDIFIGGGARMLSSMNYHMPRLIDRYNEKATIHQLQTHEMPRNPIGTLTRPGSGGQAHGDMHGTPVMRISLYNMLLRNPGLTAGMMLGIALASAVAVSRRQGA